MKKGLLVFIFIILIVSVGHAYFNGYLKANTVYQAGGHITGRINKMPIGLNSTTASLQKGDKILMNIDNPYTNDKLAWQLLEMQTYDDYGCTDKTVCTGNPSMTNWIAMSDNPIDKVTYINDADLFKGEGTCFKTVDFKDTNVYPLITSFNELLNESKQDLALVRERNLSFIHASYSALLNSSHYKSMMENGTFATPELMLNNVFIVSVYEGSDGVSGKNIAPSKDLTFSEDYATVDSYHDVPCSGVASYASFYILANNGLSSNKHNILSADPNNSYTKAIAVRPAIYLDLDDTVFAISRGSDSGIGKVHLNKLPDGYTSLYNETIEDKENGKNVPMKLRMYNSALNAQLNDIKHSNGTSITEITKNQTVKLDVSANAGNDGKGGIYTVSVIVFDQNNNFIYYQPLGNASGNGTYDFDLTGFDIGKYKIAVVNEAYNESVTSPADSSLISNVMSLEIVDYVSLTTTSKTGLEYGVNVNDGDIVATFTTKNGIKPITATLISDTTVDGHENDYQLFSLDNGNIIVNNMNGLNAGDYYFKLRGFDAFGDPVDGIDSDSIHIQVAKTTPLIAFDNPNITKQSITNANIGWDEIATPDPGYGTKVTYTKTGGDISMIDIDPDTGKITYKGNNAFGKVKIRATADDDPNTKNDNYNSAYTEKEIIIYREVDGTLTPDSASSDINIPTFSMNQANIKTGGTIGTIKGMLGTPDTIGGSTTTYKYEIKQDPNDDGSLFQVNASSGVIKANANLGVDTYKFTIIVSDKWSTKEIPVTVNVGKSPAENLKFYENSTSNTIITKKTAKLTDSGVTVFATVKGSSNNNPITYKLKDGELTNVIDLNPNSGAVTIKNVGTVIIVAEKQGASGQADASAELTFTVTAGSQEFIYVDGSGNKLPMNIDKYKTYEEVYGKDKTFKIHTDGNPAGTTVTYALKAGSPTDVFTVDPDGTVHILNASLNTQKGKVIVTATSHDPNGNYEDKTIELPIDITKANQTISFADVTHAPNGKGSVTPVINEQDLSSNAGGANVEDPDYYISVGSGSSGIAWTNNGVDIEYKYDKEEGIEIPLHVEKPGNRNYNKAEANGTMKILGQDESTLAINQPGKVEYGDHFEIRSLQDDSSSSSVKYTFEIDNTIYISQPDIKGNIAEFEALKNSGNTEIEIKVTRTADGELPLSKSVKIKVLPKPITVTIDDKEKKRLEENPPLTYQDFTSQLVTLNGVKDNVDTSHIKLTTTASKFSPIGSYPITSGNAEKQLNDNYPNYTFTIKQGKLDVKDNGDKNFWDIDDDGCPDLNIQIKDDDGNTITINGDMNDDGIPDYNIDSDGDGKPDLNIDTDNDGKPDLNLVILKEWKPTKCIENGDIKYSTGINAKAEINIDLDGDLIPDINIDTNGDMKANINISTDGKNAKLNIVEIINWIPDKNYTYQKFTYDTMDDLIPLINIDTDGDGRPDINIDLDEDGVPDINIDVDHDNIPDVDIDSTGDGKPDINIDTDGDGKPDENIIKITEWKPGHNVDDPFPYDTMTFDDPKDPDEPKQPDDPNNQEPDTDVKGAYYPGANMGGALTGDTTNTMIYMGMGSMSIGMILWIFYKRKPEE